MNLIDGLPRNSAFAEAQSQDEDLARSMLARKVPEQTAPAAPPMRDLSPEMEMLMRIYDRLGEVIQATVASNGGKPPKIKPLPRPTTALDRIRAEQQVSKHHNLADRLLGRQRGESARLARQPPPAPTRPVRPLSAGVLLKRGDQKA